MNIWIKFVFEWEKIHEKEYLVENLLVYLLCFILNSFIR